MSGGEQAACAQSQPCCLALKQNPQLAVPGMAQPGKWQRAAASVGNRVVREEDGRKHPGHEAGLAQVPHPGFGCGAPQGTKSSSLAMPETHRGFPSASPPNLLLLCSLSGGTKAQGVPCPPAAVGRCGQPQAGPCCANLPPWSCSKERMEVTSRTFGLIFFLGFCLH